MLNLRVNPCGPEQSASGPLVILGPDVKQATPSCPVPGRLSSRVSRWARSAAAAAGVALAACEDAPTPSDASAFGCAPSCYPDGGAQPCAPSCYADGGQ